MLTYLFVIDGMETRAGCRELRNGLLGVLLDDPVDLRRPVSQRWNHDGSHVVDVALLLGLGAHHELNTQAGIAEGVRYGLEVVGQAATAPAHGPAGCHGERFRR